MRTEYLEGDMVIMVKYMGIQGKDAWEIIDNWSNVKFLNLIAIIPWWQIALGLIYFPLGQNYYFNI